MMHFWTPQLHRFRMNIPLQKKKRDCGSGEGDGVDGGALEGIAT
jgi:hypothetical protein